MISVSISISFASKFGKILFGQLAQVRTHLLQKSRQIVLGRRQAFEQRLLLLGEIVDRRFGQVLAGLDNLALLFEELFQFVAQLFEFRFGVVGQIAAGTVCHLAEQVGLFARRTFSSRTGIDDASWTPRVRQLFVNMPEANRFRAREFGLSSRGLFATAICDVNYRRSDFGFSVVRAEPTARSLSAQTLNPLLCPAIAARSIESVSAALILMSIAVANVSIGAIGVR